MPYDIHHIDVEAPPDSLAVGAQEDGFALVLHFRGRIVGFLMQGAKPGTQVGSDRISELIVEAAGARLLQENLAARLRPPLAQSRPPTITAAICTKDRPALLRRCLASLTSLDAWKSRDRDFAILVVDNAPSDDGTRRLVAEFPGIEYCLEPKPGLDFARNAAMDRARTELIAYVDDDAAVDPGWLAGLRRAWLENPDAGAFTGLVLPLSLETEAQILFERRGGFRRGFQQLRFGSGHPVHWTYPCGAGGFGAGCNMAFRRDMLHELGGFDEALDTGPPLPGGGDLDIFYRIIRAGYPLVYEPQFAVYHEHRREMDRLRHQYWTWGLGFMAFVVKSYWADPTQRGRFRYLMAEWTRIKLGELRRALAGRHPLPPRMVAAEMLGAFAGLFGTYSRSLKRAQRIRGQVS